MREKKKLVRWDDMTHTQHTHAFVMMCVSVCRSCICVSSDYFPFTIITQAAMLHCRMWSSHSLISNCTRCCCSLSFFLSSQWKCTVLRGRALATRTFSIVQNKTHTKKIVHFVIASADVSSFYRAPCTHCTHTHTPCKSLHFN